MTLRPRHLILLSRLSLWVVLWALSMPSLAQTPTDSVFSGRIITEAGDTLTDLLYDDVILDEMIDTIHFDVEDATTPLKSKRDWSTWRPDPKRALWLAIVIPGGGQIYNRKYWKLPIVYGGFVGCAYAIQWNNQMYSDYSQAYLDISDNDPTTHSYNQFLHLGATINSYNESGETYYKNLFKKRKDYYRRYRDLSFFILVGVYALSVIDAYVDASLSDFDISKDLTMRVSPTILTNKHERNPLRSTALGVQCSLNF
ncbi:MAG: hypothetical protein IKH88_17580 [Prevotella sp.]|nr:hypothetical protein [Prevotella sp.]